jgi:hypothetical protein
VIARSPLTLEPEARPTTFAPEAFNSRAKDGAMPRSTDPYQDPTQGIRVGHDPDEDPTQGRELGEQYDEDPTQGRELGEEPDEDPAEGREVGETPFEDPTQGLSSRIGRTRIPHTRPRSAGTRPPN